MVSVRLQSDERPKILAQELGLGLAGWNGSQQQVYSGDEANVDQLILRLTELGIATRKLPVSHAFHSSLLEPMRESWRQLLQSLKWGRPEIPILSNLTGNLLTDAPDASYFEEHLFKPVLFYQGLQQLEKMGRYCFLELGPQAFLLKMVQRSLDQPEAHVFISGMRQDQRESIQLERARSEMLALDLSIHPGLKPGQGNFVDYPLYQFNAESFVSFHDSSRPFFQPLSGASSAAEVKLQIIRSPALKSVQILGQCEIAEESWVFLKDHCVQNRPIVPAAFYVDLILAFMKEEGKLQSHHLADLHIQRMSPLDEGGRAWQIVLEGIEGRIYRQYADEWQETAGFRLEVIEKPLELPAMPKVKTEDSVGVGEFYTQLAGFGFQYGPAFQQLKAVTELADGSLLLHLGDADHSLRCLGRVDPAILDAAFQGAAWFSRSLHSEDLFLPAGFQQIHFTNALASMSYCRMARHPQATLGSQLSFRLDFYDAAGHPIGTIGAFHLRRLPRRVNDHILQPILRVEQVDPVRSQLVGPGRQVLSFLSGSLNDVLDTWIGPFVLASEVNPSSAPLILLTDEFPGSSSAFLQYLQSLTSQRLEKTPILLIGLTDNADVHLDSFTAKQSMLRSFASEMGLTLLRTIAVASEMFPSAADWQTMIDYELGSLRQDLAMIAYRDGLRHITYYDRATALPLASGKDFAIVLERPGSVDHVKIKPLTPEEPGPHEVSIQVHACAINFRDIAHVLGLVPLDAALESAASMILGMECSGVVDRVGSSVTRLKPGMRVMALGKHCAATQALVMEHAVWPIPAGLSMTEAASLPVTALTVLHAFQKPGYELKKKWVLVTAAGGGVGLTAIAFLKAQGAHIVALASKGKHVWLRSLGLKHIFDSRSLDYIDSVRRLNQGQGLDYVLNSVSDAAIEAHLSLLKTGGVFIEIGKKGVWTTEEVKDYRDDIHYRLFDLAELLQHEPDTIQDLYRAWESFAWPQALRAPIEVYPAARFHEALDLMAKSRHIGKVVLEVQKEQKKAEGSRLSKTGTYLIIGASGGLGLALGRYLEQEGILHRLAASRQAPSDGIYTKHYSCDVRDPASVQRLAQDLQQDKMVLSGLFYLPGLLRDRPFDQLSFEDFEELAAVKLQGLQNIMRVFDLRAMDFVVCYSSIAAVLCNPHQAAYASANALLQEQCARLRAQSVPIYDLAWGPWDESGMSQTLSQRARENSRQSGLNFLRADQAHHTLKSILSQPPGSYIVANFDFAAMVQRSSIAQQKAWSHIAREFKRPEAEATAQLRFMKQGVSSAGVLQMLVTLLESKIGRSEIDPQATLSELGVDSLLLIELRSLIQTNFGVDLSPQRLSYESTVHDLSHMIQAEYHTRDVSATPEDPAEGPNVKVHSQAKGESNHEQLRTAAFIKLDRQGEDVGSKLLLAYMSGLEKPLTKKLLRISQKWRRQQEAVSEFMNSPHYCFEFVKSGAAKGVPLVFINGLNTENTLWDRLLSQDAMAAHPCYRLQLPGFGLSRIKGSRDLVSIEGIGRELAACLDARFAAYHVIGWSMGGMIAQSLARQAKQLQMLVLLASTAKISAKALSYTASAKIKDLTMLTEGSLLNFFPITSTQSRQNLFKYEYARESLRFNGLVENARILQKTLIIGGDHDLICPVHESLDLSRSIPQSQLIIMEGASHYFPLTQAPIVAATLKEFLRQAAEEEEST
jgi:NADPH:quinone reductase-like Zn-dependent oxidoreductase/pimeloyl-ACP methyl ester carboxylesterase/short-subunit dehydrogenase/acyl carrier protein